MDFARKQLEKYGWSDGKGLGKNENGISEALKPKLKRSVTGIGHDAASDFTEHWWTTLYDKAAGNVQVEEKNGKTKKIKTNEATFEITNSTWKLQRKQNETEQDQYKSFFVKKATLTSGGVQMERAVSGSESDNEVEVKRDVFKMSDEELFAACRGRTAHKGARHGLKALGKLARIEQQEQTLLEQDKYEGYSHKKKKKTKIERSDDQVVEDISLGSGEEKKKKKKKKRKHCNDHENGNENPQEAEQESSLPEKSYTSDACQSDGSNEGKSKKSKSKKNIVDIENLNDVDMEEAEVGSGVNKADKAEDNVLSVKTKKKKRKNAETDNSAMEVENRVDDLIDNNSEEDVPKKNKKKKRKNVE